MGKELNLLAAYPRTERKLDERAATKTEDDRRIARKFGKEFFDGDRRHGYGGFSYHSRFWQEVVKDIRDYYHLTPESSILDVGCGKGFMLYDFMQLIPGITLAGIDISEYAIEHAKKEVKPFVHVGDARELPFADNSFDLVLSITTIHNLDREGCRRALQEIERVSRKDKFITVDAYRTDEEKRRMDMWNLTALTYMHVDRWKEFFTESGYTGDYYWFIP
jgi:ubiquinone/menaquinone biosynthesis C-methylase UbiE